MTEPGRAGMKDYLLEAFLFRWNLLLFLGGTAAAALTPFPDLLLPLVGAAELSYLAGLVSIPRFRAAIDARVHARRTGKPYVPEAQQPPASLVTMLAGLPAAERARFERLHGRCVEMRKIAAGVRGASGDHPGSAEDIRTPGLDRLLWLFLRLLVSRSALDRFLAAMDEKDLNARLVDLRAKLATAQSSSGTPGSQAAGQAGVGNNDERVIRSLQDSIASGELRLDNFARAKKNAEFVRIELDRIEGKIQALAEMTVNRQDPDFLSSQVDSAAESMRQTEKTVSELQHLTGLGDQLQDPPAILESDLREVLKHGA